MAGNVLLQGDAKDMPRAGGCKRHATFLPQLFPCKVYAINLLCKNHANFFPYARIMPFVSGIMIIILNIIEIEIDNRSQ
jgi:hypothetical protein